MNQRLAALRFITTCLAETTDSDTAAELRRMIGSERLSWESVVALANEHLLAPALWVALQRKQLAEQLPDDLHDYLRELHHLSCERNEHLHDQLLEAVRQLNRVGVVPILLKGALHLVADIYADRGVRIMTDIDLLVSPDELSGSQGILRELGYRSDDDAPFFDEHHHHGAPLFRPGDYAALELHRDLLMKGYRHLLPLDQAIEQSEHVACQGVDMRVLSPTHRILHNILHGQLVDRQYAEGVLPLRSLYEVLTETEAAGGRVDWGAIGAVLESQGRGAMLDAYLYLAHRLFRWPLPVAGRRKLRSYLYRLRCLGQIGWPTLDAWGHRLGRLSADNICRLYNCKPAWYSLNRARLSYLQKRILALSSTTADRGGVDK